VFGVDELLLRLATVRRRRELRQGRYLRLGGMVVDMETSRFGNGTSWIWLTPKEWRVFEVLIDRRDQLVTRQHLKQAARGSSGDMSDNALEAMICRLRAKAGELGVQIRALRGAGYMLEPDRNPVEACLLVLVTPHAIAARYGLRVAGDGAVDLDAVPRFQRRIELDQAAEDADLLGAQVDGREHPEDARLLDRGFDRGVVRDLGRQPDLVGRFGIGNADLHVCFLPCYFSGSRAAPRRSRP
jgi:DNA-binding winged helix-turn-helix (wHTH) protein